MNLDDLLNQQATATVEYAGESFAVQYYPQRYTVDVHHEISRLSDNPSFDPLVNVISDLLAGWDVQSHGKALPPTKENLRKFPLMLLLAIGNAIVGHAADPNPGASDGG